MSTDVSTGGGGGSSAVASSGGVIGSSGSGGSSIMSSGAGPGSWGDDWRQRMANSTTDPEKELKRLERFTQPEDIFRSFRSLENRQSSGDLRSVLKKDATAAEVEAWRKENGIPLKPEEYKINMPAGREAPKDDDLFLKAFLKDMHDANASQAQVDKALGSFYAEVDRQQKGMTEAEAAAVRATEDALRKDWGGDYRVNMAMAEALLARAPAGFRDRFMNGYLADHTPIKASPDAWKWLVQMEREINPAASVMPGAGGDVTKTIDARILELKGLMGNPNSEYWKGPKAEPLQEEYRKLLDAQSKLSAKAKAA